MEYKQYNIGNLDLDQYTAFQKSVFTPLIEQNGIQISFPKKDDYIWKYKGAWKEATICTVEYEGAIIGASAMVPYLLEDHAGNKFWCAQVFDNALDINHRKKSIFYNLIDKTYRNEFGYTCFGFPNENAIKTILKVNCHIKDEMFFWAKLHPGFSMGGKGTTMRRISDSSELPDYDPFIPSLSIRKDQTYIKWRYFERPDRNYSVYEIRSANAEGCALIVLASFKYKGLPIQLILDAVGTNEYFHQNALRLYLSQVHKPGIYLALTNDSARCKKASFLKVPPTLAPKRHFMVYSDRAETPFQIKSLTWLTAMGDWEVF